MAEGVGQHRDPAIGHGLRRLFEGRTGSSGAPR